jgi:hypothetical protein
MTVHVRDLNGPGNFQLDNGDEGTFLWQYHEYPLYKDKAATMSLTHWSPPGSFEGLFTFSAKDSEGNIKTVEGSFHH